MPGSKRLNKISKQFYLFQFYGEKMHLFYVFYGLKYLPLPAAYYQKSWLMVRARKVQLFCSQRKATHLTCMPCSALNFNIENVSLIRQNIKYGLT